MAIRWSIRAESDFTTIIEYGAAEYGLASALDYAWGLRDRLAIIAANPRMGALRRTEPPTRLYLYHAHAIFYRIVDEDILIVRVLHGRADWAAALDLQ